jgi:hypothetical protein
MADPDTKANCLKWPISIVISLAVLFATWFPTRYCPNSTAGIDALKHSWFWAGQACENLETGFGAIAAAFCSIWLLVFQALLTFAILSPRNVATPNRKYISVASIAVVFFLIYLLLFAL